MADEKPHAPPPPYEAARAERSTTAEAILEPLPEKHDPYAAFRISAFRFYTAGNLISVIGRLMFIVAVEWEMYGLTNSATALGLVGLVIALPVVLLSLPAGHIADRFPRKRIVLVTQALSSICSLALAFVSWNHLRSPNWAALRSANHCLYSVATPFERHAYCRFDDRSLPLL